MSFTSGPYATQAQIVLRTDQEFQRKNTSLAYDPKMKEFKEYKVSNKIKNKYVYTCIHICIRTVSTLHILYVYIYIL